MNNESIKRDFFTKTNLRIWRDPKDPDRSSDKQGDHKKIMWTKMFHYILFEGCNNAINIEKYTIEPLNYLRHCLIDKKYSQTLNFTWQNKKYWNEALSWAVL